MVFLFFQIQLKMEAKINSIDVSSWLTLYSSGAHGQLASVPAATEPGANRSPVQPGTASSQDGRALDICSQPSTLSPILPLKPPTQEAMVIICFMVEETETQRADKLDQQREGEMNEE